MTRPVRNNCNRVLLVDVRCYKNEMIVVVAVVSSEEMN
jgi:hypothetical protein